ncbi:MAG TPA: ferritin-like domain-containing protein [Leucothrix mucor]|nr:ferritin-like domain-containing protein [Leucothrix mucor]
MNIHQLAYQALMEANITLKLQQVDTLYSEQKKLKISPSSYPIKTIPIPGRPSKPELISPKQLKHRKLNSEIGRANLIHAITHIEFNAINLALDAVYRFQDMPADFYIDWLQVASEEAYHFTLLRDRLEKMGFSYGDMQAHNGLWEMTVKTDHDVLVRMALVPRVLEARGLDVTPGMMERLEKVGDQETVDILEIILRDEIGHVAIGSKWFHYCCEKRNLESEATFRELLMEYMGAPLRAPFYTEARLQAGFTQQEMEQLVAMEQQWTADRKKTL